MLILFFIFLTFILFLCVEGGISYSLFNTNIKVSNAGVMAISVTSALDALILASSYSCVCVCHMIK